MSNAEHESKKHHFVPEFLLSPWLIEEPFKQLNLLGFWYCPRQRKLTCKRKGLGSFCFQLDLLTLSSHRLGRDAVERIFFGSIDTKGAAARDILLARGAAALTEDQRCDFARLLLSLEARRPAVVNKIRTAGADYLSSELDKDLEILSAFAQHGIQKTPTEYAEHVIGWSLEDKALLMIRGLVDDPNVGGRLINAKWDVKTIRPQDGSLVLSDRPLIRVHGYDSPGAAWVLPLTPTAAFIAANHEENLRRLQRATGQRFAKLANISSAARAERFVFSTQEGHRHWLEKYLKQRALGAASSALVL